jgi:PAS domain S-box-containing protein
LNLISGAGEIGDQMVAEERSIPLLAEKSLVARAARTREGVTVNDVVADPNFLPHPLLPDTKAELAVPMIAGDEVLGVLDVQADKAFRFTQDDIDVLTTLASQVSATLLTAQQYVEVRQSEALVRDIINATPDWIFVKNLEHRYVMANQGYADSLHIPVEDFIGKDDIELGFPEELVKGDPERGIRGFWADDNQVFETGEPVLVERDIVQVDGRERVYSTLKTPLTDAAGNVTSVLIFARDVTEREELLQETRSQAEQEALINAISQKIQATTSVESALQVAIRELGDSLGAEKTSIRLGVDAGQRMRKK